MGTHKTIAEEARNVFSEVVENAGPAIKHAYRDTERAAENAVESATRLIKKHPIQSVLIGFGVGCLAGFALRAFKNSEA